MRKFCPLRCTLRIEERDPEKQKIYLDNIIKLAKDSNTSVRFQYDLDGQSHWDGKYFILEVAPICSVRYATGLVWRKQRDKFSSSWRWIPSSICCQELIDELTSEDLHAALNCFLVDEIMTD